MALDVSKTLSIAWAGSPDAKEESLRVFAAVLRHWKTAVEATGGAFYVVFLPMDTQARGWSQNDAFLRARRVVEQDVRAQTVDLLACAKERIPNFQYQTIRFRNDAHWNEAGNMLAAQCMYRFIEGSSDLPHMTEAALTDRLYTYYSAFRSNGGQSPLLNTAT